MAAEDVVITRHRITVEEFHRLAASGVLPPEARVELLHGEVLDMAPIGTRHRAAVSRHNLILVEALQRRALVAVQQSLRPDRRNEVQPDLAVLRWGDDFYAGALPSGTDALLVVEVADTSPAYDLSVKAPLYARHGVPAYWVVDLRAGMLRRFADPHRGAYTSADEIMRPGRIALPGVEGAEVDWGPVLFAGPEAAP